VHRDADDLSTGKNVILGIMKECKDVGIKDRSMAWNTDLIETVKLNNLIKQVGQAGGRGRAWRTRWLPTPRI
jgi:succinate dehydrogenase (ubiquinone) flavoprotein subunit